MTKHTISIEAVIFLPLWLLWDPIGYYIHNHIRIYRVVGPEMNSEVMWTIHTFVHHEARALATQHVPDARNNWEAMLLGYQVILASELSVVQHVQLDRPLSQIISKPGKRTICKVCGEEIIHGREVLNSGMTSGRAGAGYDHALAPLQSSPEGIPLIS